MSYQSVILGDSPSGFWRLNEATGTVANDISGNSFNGTYTGGFTLGVNGIPGDSATATQFDGSTGYVDIPNQAVFSTANFSIEGWVKRIATGGATQALFAKGSGGAGPDEWDLFLISGGVVIGYLGNTAVGAYIQASYGTPAALSVWTYYALTYDGTTLRLYANGVQVASSTTTTGTRQGASTLHPNIGRRQDNLFYANAAIADVAYYNSVLSAAQVLAHYNAGAGSPTPGTQTGTTTFQKLFIPRKNWARKVGTEEERDELANYLALQNWANRIPNISQTTFARPLSAFVPGVLAAKRFLVANIVQASLAQIDAYFVTAAPAGVNAGSCANLKVSGSGGGVTTLPFSVAQAEWHLTLGNAQQGVTLTGPFVILEITMTGAPANPGTDLNVTIQV